MNHPWDDSLWPFGAPPFDGDEGAKETWMIFSDKPIEAQTLVDYGSRFSFEGGLLA